MTISSRTAATVIASLVLFASPTLAQTTAPAAKSEKMAKPRSTASIECSKEADAKGLHGKERKKFRAECKKEKAGEEKK